MVDITNPMGYFDVTRVFPKARDFVMARKGGQNG